MPRIDPIQLLKCISVLLSQRGGIKSQDEVQRLASLMTKFSKKLVSKCIYIQILKATETELLGLFMGSGGWRLVHMWLTESIVSKNWPLIHELLELLLLCPVDIERLKTNNCPKLVKELSKEENYFAIRALASKLVEQWLKTVKGEHVIPITIDSIPSIISNAAAECNISPKKETSVENNETISNHVSAVTENHTNLQSEQETMKVEENNDKKTNEVVKATPEDETEKLPVLKISLKDGKQVVSQEDTNAKSVNQKVVSEEKSDKHNSSSSSSKSSKDKHRSDKHSSHSSSSSHKKSKHSSSKSSSSSDKSRSRHSSSSPSKDSKDKKESSRSHSSKSRSDESNSKSSKHRDRDKSHDKSKEKDDRTKEKEDKTKDRDEKSKKHSKDKEREHKSTSKTSNDKDRDNKKDKDSKSLESSQSPQPSIHKLGKIPKLSDVKKDKLSISIEVRKPDDPKPKTVKTFHSKFRKHGLEEEIKPPPSRSTVLTKKVNTVTTPPVIPKRTSPIHNNEAPPEKRTKIIEPIERPGAVKLIPAKPKPVLLESDMFMDALNASTTTHKKDPKKRKRRTSVSNDGKLPNETSPPHTPTTPTSSSPSVTETKSVPMRFYQETLPNDETEDSPLNKSTDKILDKSDSVCNDNNKDKKENEEKMDVSEPVTLTVNGLKGILCYHKKRGPKRGIKWKTDLEEIQYFELDETERVNVTKPFTDMKYLERIHERDAFQKGRNLSNDDVMEEKTSWRPLIPIDCEDQPVVEYGKNSKEKEIQASRQKGTLQPLYFNKSMIPDSPTEPDVEVHNYSEPRAIPLEDSTGSQDSISDFRNMPWPEPKGAAPPSNSNINMPTMFQPPMTQFPGNIPNPQFPGPPGFQPNMVPTEWPNGVPPPMMTPGMVPNAMMPANMPPTGMPPGPGMMMPPDGMIMHPEMFNGMNGVMFPPMGPPEGFNMNGPPNMFPNDFNMAQEGAPGSDNFRGGMRGRGHWRGGVGHNWEGPPRGRGAHSRGSRKPVCIYFQRKGSCWQGDKCAFLHTVTNRPY